MKFACGNDTRFLTRSGSVLAWGLILCAVLGGPSALLSAAAEYLASVDRAG